jgi:hypothetical protein
MKEVSLLKLLKKRVKLFEELDQIEFEIESRSYGQYVGYKIHNKNKCLKKIEQINNKIKPLLIEELEKLE